MHRNAAARVSTLVVSLGASLLMTGGLVFAAESRQSPSPTVGFATRHGRSAPLRNYRPVGPFAPRPSREVFNDVRPKKGSGMARPTSDPVAQKQFGLSQPEALTQFEGGSDADNAAVVGYEVVPSDTEGDVGPNHYIQYINLVYTIYDKAGNIALGPLPGNAFWAGLGGPCENQNDGDPLVRYDRQADRWVFSQFALPNFPDGPFYQCVAVSTTSDPTGDYWQYEFKTSDDFFSDYGKLGVWPDAYYMTFNMFGPAPDHAFRGGAYAFDRSAMLSGAPAGMIIFDTGLEGGVLPSDLDGPTPPPPGSPNYFMTYEVNPARLLEWQFHVDWTTPANSTFTGPIEIPVAEFISPVCGADRGQCVPQSGTPALLETLEQDLMYRLPYRNFGDHQSIVANHTVGTEDGSAAVRWYEVRNPGDAPTVYQQGTYAPDADFRWMGSIAMDGNGNIALGYSEVEPDHPSVHRDHGPARRRSARFDGRRRRLVRRGREPGGSEPLGRLQHDVDRSGRRLHLLVHAGVLRLDGQFRLQDSHRRVPVSELHDRRRGRARGHSDERFGSGRRRDGNGNALGHPACGIGRVDDHDGFVRPLPVPHAAARRV